MSYAAEMSLCAERRLDSVDSDVSKTSDVRSSTPFVGPFFQEPQMWAHMVARVRVVLSIHSVSGCGRTSRLALSPHSGEKLARRGPRPAQRGPQGS